MFWKLLYSPRHRYKTSQIIVSPSFDRISKNAFKCLFDAYFSIISNFSILHVLVRHQASHNMAQSICGGIRYWLVCQSKVRIKFPIRLLYMLGCIFFSSLICIVAVTKIKFPKIKSDRVSTMNETENSEEKIFFYDKPKQHLII